MITVNNLVKRYKELVALDHMDLEVRDGEILGLLGPNGSGKTTLIHCILSLLSYDKGEVLVMGERFTPDTDHIKREIGLVPQDVAVMEHLNVQENIDFFCGLYIDDKKTRKRYVDEAIEFVGLNDYRKFIPKKLSGGLKRRLNIACGIAHKPKLIFFDEPTVAVDAQSRNFILDGIKRLNEAGSTIVYTSHYLEEVEEICSRIVIIDSGRSIASGTLDQLKDSVATGEKIVVEFLHLSDEQEKELQNIHGLISMDKSKQEYQLHFEKGRNNLIQLIDFIEKNNLTYSKLYSDKPSLNDVFLALTGKELRD
ncbi:MAG: ABC transporter ATP-binding protein [Peptostreptococcaceae bacterium]|nr:ABC transporter ATP-binding protein [Peptostreptococcaceae bacterium]